MPDTALEGVFEETPLAAMRDQFAVNGFGAAATLQAALPYMRARRRRLAAPVNARRNPAAPSKGDLREQAILDTIERLRAAPGYESMTMASIASGTGVTRGALYFYFGSKQDVVTALVARTVRSLHEKSRAAADDPAAPRLAIETAMRRTAAIWLEHGLVMRAAIDLAPVIPAVGELWDETAGIFIHAIATILERAGIPPGTQPGQASAMAAPVCWMIERSFYHAATKDLERTSATCQDLWLRLAGLA